MASRSTDNRERREQVPNDRKPIGKGSRRVLLKTPAEVRAYCLSHDNPNIALTLRNNTFRYKIRRSKKGSVGWFVVGRIPITDKAPGVRPKEEARIGKIGADFKFSRSGISLRDDHPIVKALLEFYEIVFVRNVMRPAEMKVEAEIRATAHRP
jgi:hypothetical protein